MFREYVSDVSDDDDDIAIEDWTGSDAENLSDIDSDSSSNPPKAKAATKKARIEVEYEDAILDTQQY